jgi:hypothetical protein
MLGSGSGIKHPGSATLIQIHCVPVYVWTKKHSPDGADVPLEEAEASAVQGHAASQPVLAHYYYRYRYQSISQTSLQLVNQPSAPIN